jgi:hypothetical protein
MQALAFILAVTVTATTYAQSPSSSAALDDEAGRHSSFAASIQFLDRLGCHQRAAQAGSAASDCEGAQPDLEDAARRANGVVDERVRKRIQEDQGRGTIRWSRPSH